MYTIKNFLMFSNLCIGDPFYYTAYDHEVIHGVKINDSSYKDLEGNIIHIPEDHGDFMVTFEADNGRWSHWRH